MVNSKNAFWQALLVSIFIFVAGLVLGFYVEVSNTNKSDFLIRNAEVDLLDQQMKIEFLSSNSNLNCEIAKDNLFEFADQLYADAVEFEQADVQLTLKEREVLHKRYDLLRLSLWSESLSLRAKCGDNFHTLLYTFDYASEDIDVRAQQQVFSLILMDLKYKYPDQILLLPVASNLNIGSVDVVKENYNITKSPSILVDENIVLDELVSFDELEFAVFGQKSDKKVIILKS